MQAVINLADANAYPRQELALGEANSTPPPKTRGVFTAAAHAANSAVSVPTGDFLELLFDLGC